LARPRFVFYKHIVYIDFAQDEPAIDRLTNPFGAAPAFIMA